MALDITDIRNSEALTSRAHEVFPGAINSNNYFLPAVGGPLFIERADGVELVDVDGNRLIDFWISHSAVLVGHNNPVVRAAVEDQLSRGSNFGLAATVQVELAERLKARFPSLERLVFTDSNTRANSYAIRLARAYTGRSVIAKIQGGYHGTVDTFWVGLQKVYGEPYGERVVRPGVPQGVVDDVVLIQWNDEADTRRVFAEYGEQLAGLLVEPVLGDGVIEPAPGYLELLKDLCDEHGALLLFDEAVTCGMSSGGAQVVYDVIPHICVVGKAVGGGMPLAAVGASEEIMELADCRSGMPPVPVSMTYAGHPVACAAGVAQLDLLGDSEYEHMRRLADRFKAGVDEIASEKGVPLSATTARHLFFMHWHEGPMNDWHDHYECDDPTLARIQDSILRQGIYLGSKGRACMTVAHTDEHVDQLLEALSNAVDEVS